MSTETTILNEETKSGGAFVLSLMRNNKKIREDRAIQIGEDTELLFKRSIEDAELQIRQLKRDRENMLDLSPTSADSLVLASDFKADEFVKKYIEIGVKIHSSEIKLEIARNSYTHLFGKTI